MEKKNVLNWIKEKLKYYKSELLAIRYAMTDERTPLLAKILAAVVVGYALSPIDLIPDFIPVLGYLDDALLLPLGIALTIKLIPKEVLAESRIKAKEKPLARESHKFAALVIVLIWVGLVIYLVKKFL